MRLCRAVLYGNDEQPYFAFERSRETRNRTKLAPAFGRSMNSLVFSNMLHRPARTVVSIVGIGIGILLIVFTVGLANGTMRERAQRESNVGAEIMFRASGSL